MTTPLYDILRAQRTATLISIASAEHCLAEPLLEAYRESYARRLEDYRILLALIDAKLAAIPVAPVYAGGRREELQALTKAYRAKQVTPREFGQRAGFLRRMP